MVLRAEPSAVHELAVAIFNLSTSDESLAQLPWAQELMAERPDLAGRVRSLWPDGRYLMRTGFEILVMAQALDYLADPEADRFLADLPAIPGKLLQTYGWRPPEPLPDLELMMRERFEELTQPARMAEYSALLREVWDWIRPRWEEEGRVKVEGECLLFMNRAGHTAAWPDLLPPGHPARLEAFSHLMASWDPVVVSPSFLARGLHFVAVRGRLFVGYGMLFESLSAAARERARELGPRLKALGDPTRLTLMAWIAKIGMGVSDLARMMGVAQPTVSEHLRILREAGFVRSRKVGTKVYYMADADAVEGLLEEARTHLTRDR